MFGNQKSNNSKGFLSRLFSKYTVGGLGLILGSICINVFLLDGITQSFKSDFGKVIIKIIAELIETIGIALTLGAIFDFAKNSDEFLNYVSGLLSKIVISKDFLSRLAENDKKDALKLILKPTNDQLEQYSNINNYFSSKIDESTEMFATNFKSHVIISAKAELDQDKVVVSGIIRYRIYKIQDKYEPIVIEFDDNRGQIERRRIIAPDGGETFDIDEKDIKANGEEMEKGGLHYKKYKFEIPEKFLKYRYLTIESEFEEPGEDHWTTFNWTSLTPYDGVEFVLDCQDDLIIKKRTLFDKKDKYRFTLSPDETRLYISANGWLDAFTGFSILIAKKAICSQTASASNSQTITDISSHDSENEDFSDVYREDKTE